jgi:hypothetical protein
MKKRFVGALVSCLGACGGAPIQVDSGLEDRPAVLEIPDPRGGAARTFSADSTQNLTVPALGRLVSVSGRVVDDTGASLAGYTVGFSSRALDDAGLAGDSFYVVAPATLADGSFGVRLPPGKYEKVAVKRGP